jgi:serine/threonine-protein kinase
LDDSSRPGTAKDRYEVVSELATGGMATVYLGRLVGARGFSRTVAVKVMHPQYAKDRAFCDMFVDEARLSARIRHPNVVPTLDVIDDVDRLDIVMEYVEGESLSALLKTCRAEGRLLPRDIACVIVHDLLSGLHAAHEARGEDGEPLSIVHRDVSPQNVLVGVDGLSRVIDFGVAKARGRLHSTHNGEIKGKIPYMPPEQLYGEELDRRVDVYSAGVVLWEALAGKRLYDQPNEAAVVLAITEGRVVPPSTFAEGIPPALDAVVMRALEKSPGDRFATAHDMAAALEDAAPLASRRKVVELVREVAREKLEERSRIVRALESGKSSAARARPADVATVVEGLPASSPSGSARGPALAMSSSPSTSLPSGDRPLRVTVLLAAAMVALAAILLISSLVPRAEVPRASADASPSPPEPAASSSSVVSAAPPPSAPSVAASVPAAPSIDAAAKSAPPRPPTTKKKPDDCNPPYTVDAEGHRHYKVECL